MLENVDENSLFSLKKRLIIFDENVWNKITEYCFNEKD
jgi:hypothetical protein